MAGKINTLSLKIPEGSNIKRFKIVDEEDNPDHEISVVFKKLGMLDRGNVPVLTAEIVQNYITGQKVVRTGAGGVEEVKYLPPLAIPPLGGELVTITEGAARFIAVLMTSQHAVEEYRYSVEEWAHILAVPYYQEELIKISAEHIMADVVDDIYGSEGWMNEEIDDSDPLAAEGGEESAGTSSSTGAKATGHTPAS